MEFEIPDGNMAEATFNKIFEGVTKGLAQAKWLYAGTAHGKFVMLHQRSESFTESMFDKKEVSE